MTIPILSVISVIGYIIICLAIGYYAYTRTGMTVTEYFVAGRKLGSLIMVSTMVATYISAFLVTGIMGFFYAHGLVYGPANYLWNVLAGIFIWVFGSRIWLVGKAYGHITPGDMFGEYYESKFLKLVVALIGAIFILPHFFIQLMAAGYAFQAIGKVPFAWGALIIVVVIVIYVWMGGMRGVAWTDALQGLVVFSLVTVFVIWILVKMGGWYPMFSKVAEMSPARMTPPGPRGIFTFHGLVLPLWFYYGVGAVFQPFLWMRLYAASSLKAIRNTAVFTSIFTFYASWVVTFLALGVMVLLPDLKGIQADQGLMLLSAKYVPYLAVVLLLATAAAAFSTGDTIVFTASTIVTRDLYQKLINPEATQRNVVLVGKIAVLAFAIAGYYFAFKKPGYIIDISMLTWGTCSMFLWPAIGCFFWKRGTSAGAISCLIVGLLTMFAVYFGWFGIKKFALGFHFCFWGVMTSAVTYFVVSIFTKPPRQEMIEKYHGLIEKSMYGS